MYQIYDIGQRKRKMAKQAEVVIFAIIENILNIELILEIERIC